MFDMYWGHPDTSIHFCEDKYVINSMIAEYYNTLSSLCYILVGSLFIKTKLGWSIISTGIGSVLLHGTLRFYGQWLDEMSMIITSMLSIQYFKKDLIEEYHFPIILIFYILIYKISLFFCILFIIVNIYIGYLFWISYKKCGSIYNIFVAGGSICWLLDKLFCEYVKPYHLHAWWHVLTSIALYIKLKVYKQGMIKCAE